MAIGTARMASMCLPNAELHVGVDFSRSSALSRALADPARPPALLWPGEGAIDVAKNPPAGPITLVVVDGTWWQAKKLVRVNPQLAALPRYAFVPPAPSEYRIRREPQDDYVSTIEALVHVLGVLERDPERFRALLVPFRAMIDRQIHFATNVRGFRERHFKGPPKPKRPRIPPVLAAGGARIVCLSTEANAWPYRDRELRTAYREELVHVVAHRPATGETFDLVVTPTMPVAPSTPGHVGLSPEDLRSGVSREELWARWRAFTREDDVVCTWGPYAPTLFTAAGGELPRARVDVRVVARSTLKGPVGSMESLLALLGANMPSPITRGRAGLRVAQLARIADALAARARAAESDAAVSEPSAQAAKPIADR